MISVIIPFYNSREWLGRLVKSCEQEGDFEFIFVNDGSTDGGEELIPDRFILMDNEHKKGVSGARNTGIDHATGEWITFADADDELMPNAYKILKAAAVGNINQLNHSRFYVKHNRHVVKYANHPGTYTSQNLPRMWNAVWNKIIRREFLDDIRFNEKVTVGEDTLFTLACLAKEDKIHHSGGIAYRRWLCNPNSLSKTKTEKDLFKYIRELESFIRKQDDPNIRQACCRIFATEWASKTYMRLIGHA